VRLFKEDKITFIKDVTSRLSRSTSRSVLNRINSLQDKLIIFTSYKESLAHTSAKPEDQVGVLFAQEQEFQSVGLINVDDKGAVSVSWALRNPQNTSATSWPLDFEKTLLAKLEMNGAKGKGRALWAIKGPIGQNLFVFGLRVEMATSAGQGAALNGPKTWVAGVLPETAFDDLFADFSTGINKVYLLDNRGVAIVASDPSLRWNNLKTETLFSDAIQQSKNGGTSEYILGGRKVMGSFDAVDKTNLVIVVTTPEDKAFDVAGSVAGTIYFVGATLLLVALGLSILFSNYFITGPIKKMAAAILEMSHGRFNFALNISNKDEIDELATSLRSIESGISQKKQIVETEKTSSIHEEKMNAFRQLSGGIAHEIKNPLAGILGHIQLALVKANDESKSHLELAEKEIRRCKNIIESLAKLGSTEKMSPQLTNLAQVAQDAINLVDHSLSQSHCKIYKDFRPCHLVNIDSAHVQQVVVAILNNAGQAMETTGEKNVTIRVMEVGGWAKILIEDTGVGIRLETKDKIFEPFYTTKSGGKGMGLNLAVGQNVVKEFGGEITFHSGDGGKGTIFEVSFPLPEKRVMPEKALANIFGGQAVEEEKPASPPSESGIVFIPQVEPTAIPSYDLDSAETIPEIIEMKSPSFESMTPKTQVDNFNFEVPAGATVHFEPLQNQVPPPLKSLSEDPTNMPPVPEEAIFLDRIRPPSSIPIPSVGLPTSLPKRPTHQGEESYVEVPVAFVPSPQGMAQPTLRQVPDFKVTIRRPKLRG
jgi:signal transduction histidine kinase